MHKQEFISAVAGLWFVMRWLHFEVYSKLPNECVGRSTLGSGEFTFLNLAYQTIGKEEGCSALHFFHSMTLKESFIGYLLWNIPAIFMQLAHDWIGNSGTDCAAFAARAYETFMEGQGSNIKS